MREKYESLPATTLKDLAKSRGIKGVTGMKKADVIEAMLIEDKKTTEQKTTEQKTTEQKTTEKKTATEGKSMDVTNVGVDKKTPAVVMTETSKEISANATTSLQNKNQGSNSYYEVSKKNQIVNQNQEQITADEMEKMDSGLTVTGIIEVLQDGYGFIRSNNYFAGDHDIYVAPTMVKRFGLRTGDIVTGNVRVKTGNEKFSALLFISSINGADPSLAYKRIPFEKLTPIFPNERIRLINENSSVAMRVMDLISPIGKGQRGMIVAPPKAGKTTLLKETAIAIRDNNPNTHLLILLIDERPEEVTDIKEALEGSNVEVIYSTFDEKPENHKRVAEMVIERAKRLVEHKKDVTILLDSITRLARAYNLVVSPSGRTLSGGLDPAALHMPKRFFGAARNMREHGSLTILATALVETGSKMDDVVYEEFKGTGNMELVLSRNLQERRIFPALDIPKSGTRREDLLLNAKELEAMNIIRKALNGMKQDEAVDNLLNMFQKTKNNSELIERVIRQKYI